MDNTNKDQEKKDILNYESQYGKDLHKKELMEDVRKKEIKKYEKDHEKQFHERNNSKERTNINMYVDNLNIDKFDNSNYGNNITSSGQGNLDLNMNWSIKSSEPLSNNNGLQLQKSNNIKEEDIKNSKIYKDMENNYKETLDRFNDSTYKLSEADAEIKKLKKFISKFIDFVLLFIKDKDDQKKITAVMKMYMEDDDNE